MVPATVAASLSNKAAAGVESGRIVGEADVMLGSKVSVNVVATATVVAEAGNLAVGVAVGVVESHRLVAGAE